MLRNDHCTICRIGATAIHRWHSCAWRFLFASITFVGCIPEYKSIVRLGTVQYDSRRLGYRTLLCDALLLDGGGVGQQTCQSCEVLRTRMLYSATRISR